jgi:hypothetical protein
MRRADGFRVAHDLERDDSLFETIEGTVDRRHSALTQFAQEQESSVL